jgi:hypothetical protein
VYALPQHDDIISSSVAYQRHDTLLLPVLHPSHAEAIVPNDDHIAAAANVQALANPRRRPPNALSAKTSLSAVSFPTEGVPARSIADINTRGDSIVRSRTHEGFISLIQGLKIVVEALSLIRTYSAFCVHQIRSPATLRYR